jgi:YVTN family beta-propeller protein
MVSDSNGCSASGIVTVNLKQAPIMYPLASQVTCKGYSTTPIYFSGTASQYSWTNSNPAIGLPANGTGDIASFLAANNTSSAISATITVTPSSPSFSYVTNWGSNNVLVVNNATNTVVDTIPVATGPTRLCVSPDGTRLYVTSREGGVLSIINTATNSVMDTIPLGKWPGGVAVSPDGSRVYVAGQFTNSVFVINPATRSIVATITSSSFANPLGAAISPDGSMLYISNLNGRRVTVINTATYTVLTNVNVEINPEEMAISPDGSSLYVSNSGSMSVSVINTQNNTLRANIPVGKSPIGIAASPDGSRAYVANYGANNVQVLNTYTYSAIATIPVGTSPTGVGLSPDGTRLYVNNQLSSSLSVISTANYALLASVKAGNQPMSFGNFVSGNPCSGTPTSFSITVNPSPSATASSNSPLCVGSTLTLASGGAGTCTWAGPNGYVASGQNQSIPTVSTPNSGLYTVTITDAGGCSATASTNVTVNSSPAGVHFSGRAHHILPGRFCAAYSQRRCYQSMETERDCYPGRCIPCLCGKRHRQLHLRC